MRNFDKNINSMAILPHNIAFCYTSESDYDMNRTMILSEVDGIDKYGEYLVIEGGHCSCYNFDETSWTGTVYALDELRKLAAALSVKEYNSSLKEWWGIVAKNI